MNTYIIFHSIFMGFGIYMFVSKITGNKILSIPSAVAASICGSIIAGHTRHLNSMTAIAYAPWLLYSVELFLSSKKISRALVLGLLLGLLVLIGHPQFAFISGFIAILYLFLRIAFDKKTRGSLIEKIKSYKVLYYLLIALAIFSVIGYPQLKSTLELVPFTERGQELTSEFTGLGSLPFSGILTFVYPYYMGNAGDMTFKSDSPFLFWEFFAYCGAITFLLAVFGVYKMWSRSEYQSIVRPLLIIAVLCYLLSLGENLPLYKIFSLFPVIKAFRFQARWLLGTELSVLALSGFGVISILEFWKGRSKHPEERKSTKKTKAQPESKAKVPAFSLNLQYKTALFVSAAIAFEIFFVAGKQVTTTEASVYLNPPSFVNQIRESNIPVMSNRLYTLSRVEFFTAAYSKSKGWEGSHDMFSLGTKLLPPEIGSYFGVPIIDGYLLLVPSFIYEIWGTTDKGGVISKTARLTQNKSFEPNDQFVKLSKMFSVKFMTSAWNVSKPYEQIWDSSGIKAFKLPDELPKAWVVSKVDAFATGNDNANAQSLISDKFDPWNSAYIEGAIPNLPLDSRNGTAQVISYGDHYLTIRVNDPGFLVINDTWYPRWRAYIDGEEVPIYKTNVMMRGVVAPKAGTIVEMRYDQGNVFLFAMISYFAMLLSVGYIIYEKRKEKNKESI